MGKGESPGGWGRRGVGDALEDSQGCLTQFQTSAERLLGPGWLGLAGGFSGAGRGGGGDSQGICGSPRQHERLVLTMNETAAILQEILGVISRNVMLSTRLTNGYR